jgi:NAD(P)-dependent dehydrogenase (short-subunit alcohol dehydrogenase family)
MIKLDDKVIIVTGSSRGFGRAMAYSFAKRGAKTIMIALEKNELNDASKLIQSFGGYSYTICTDLSKIEDLYNLYCEINTKFHRVDAIINNAAVCPWHKIEETSAEEWDNIFAVNIRAPFLLSKLFMNTMQKNGGGSIINITSRSAEIGFIAEVAFSPSKWAIEGLTQCLALELQPRNIAVNTLKVASPKGKHLKPTGMTLEEVHYLPSEYRKRFPTEEEMSKEFGDAWAFLALQNAQGITGQRIDTRELSVYLRDNVRESAIEKWKQKLTEAKYVSYDFPERVKYQIPAGGTAEQKFLFQ